LLKADPFLNFGQESKLRSISHAKRSLGRLMYLNLSQQKFFVTGAGWCEAEASLELEFVRSYDIDYQNTKVDRFIVPEP